MLDVRYIKSMIPKNIWNDMPSAVKDEWDRQAYYFYGTPIQFAIQFISTVRSNPQEYKKELLELMNLNDKRM